MTYRAPARHDTAIVHSPPSDERARFARLRDQPSSADVPRGLETVIVRGAIPAHKMDEARKLWELTRDDVKDRPSDVHAAERLCWLAQALATMLLRRGDAPNATAIVEASLDALELPRHRQSMRARLARIAAREGDIAGAEAMLDTCDPRSEDLEMDSHYRVTRAYVDTARGDYAAVLATLGREANEVPFHAWVVTVGTILQANALEREGDVDGAVRLLRERFGGVGASWLEEQIAPFPASWRVCERSFPMMRQALHSRAMTRATRGSALGTGVWLSVLAAGLLVGGVASIGASVTAAVMLLGMSLLLGALGVRIVLRAQRARLIARSGIAGRGRVVRYALTSTTINDVPLVDLFVEIDVPGHPARTAQARVLHADAATLVGKDVAIVWHPKFPNDVVVDEGRPRS